MTTHHLLNIGMYSPYLSVMGGGERYFLSIARCLSRHHSVTLYGSESISSKAMSLFHMSLDRLLYRDEREISDSGPIRKYQILRKYDIFFFMTDGSLFFPSSKKNYLIIQSPDHIPSAKMMSGLKWNGWEPVCYSSFMDRQVFQRVRKKTHILSPAVDLSQYQQGAKEKEPLILSVGRFFPYPHNKKHDVLINTFIEQYHKAFSHARLVIAGGLTEDGGKAIVEQLQQMAHGYPIDILVNPSFADLLSLYQRASVYWHAAGYGEDLLSHPERAEHFGMTTLEAMACGAVPVVYESGGQKDIVYSGVNGLFWKEKSQLVSQTQQLLDNPLLRKFLSCGAVMRAKDFSLEAFDQAVLHLAEGGEA